MENQIPNQETKIQEPEEVKKQKFLSSGWVKIGGTLLLVLLLVGGAYYFGTQKTTNTQPSDTPTPTVSQAL